MTAAARCRVSAIPRLNDVFQFAHVTRPLHVAQGASVSAGMLSILRPRRRAILKERLLPAVEYLPDARAGAAGGRENVQAVIEIATELAIGDHFFRSRLVAAIKRTSV